MLLIKILSLITGFFRPLITTIKTVPDNMANVEQDGALIPNSSLIPAIQALANFGAPAFGNWSQTLVPASLTAFTIPGAAMVGGIIRRLSPGAAFTDSTDTGTNIFNSIPGAKVNQSFPLLIANLGSGLMTLASNTGVAISGTNSIGSGTCRLFLGTVTGSNAITLTGCFGWNLGTNGTLVAGL